LPKYHTFLLIFDFREKAKRLASRLKTKARKRFKLEIIRQFCQNMLPFFLSIAIVTE